MFTNTYKKEFIAKAAIELMKEVVRYDMEHGVINNDTEGKSLEEAVEWQARRAALMAETLADSLDNRWYDGQTAFFDPEDPAHGLNLVADAINNFTEKYFEDE